jgi:hypothetical protein
MCRRVSGSEWNKKKKKKKWKPWTMVFFTHYVIHTYHEGGEVMTTFSAIFWPLSDFATLPSHNFFKPVENVQALIFHRLLANRFYDPFFHPWKLLFFYIYYYCYSFAIGLWTKNPTICTSSSAKNNYFSFCH